VRRAVLFAVASAAFLMGSPISPVLHAQRGAPPPAAGQANSSNPPKTTALILGQVVDGTSGQPISESVVTLSGNGMRGGGVPGQLGAANLSPQQQQAMQAALAAAAAAAGRGPGGPLRVMTGADGRFVFHDLAPGTYQLTATQTGYTATLSANAGANAGLVGLVAAALAPSGAPTVVPLKEGEYATNVKLRLGKNAVISGTVLDDAGEPAIGLTVQVARRVMGGGRARFVPGASARTDDRGMYRLSGLVPADYLVVVPQTQVSMPTALLSGIIEGLTSGAGMGPMMFTMLDVISSGIDPQSSMTGGVRLGDYMVASSGSVPLLGPDGRLQAYQTSFYPNAFAPAQATVINLKSGEDKTDVNFQLSLISTSRVSGVAMGPDGPVPNLGVHLVVPGDGVISESEVDVATALTRADGTFAFYGVPPGQFLLRANKQPRPEIPAELMAQGGALGNLFSGATPPKGANEMLFATTTVSVSNSDVDGVVVQLATGFHVSGRVAFESQTNRPLPQPAQIQTVTVSMIPMDGRQPGGLLGDITGPDRANDKSEFKTKAYAPGKYFLNVSGPAAWQVKSIAIGGRDVLDAPLEVKDADVAGLVVTFTDKMGTLTGTVHAGAETDLSETTVLLFPANYQGWIDAGMNPRRTRTARATRPGAYTFNNVPPGDYLVAALDRSNEGDMQDPAFIAALAKVAAKVTITLDPVTQELQRTRVVR